MTNPKTQPNGVAIAAPSNWLVPPVLIPIVLSIMIVARAVYLAYPW